MEKLSINLFGLFEARADGVPVRLPTRRVEALLAILALEPGKAFSRSYLAALIWPGQPDDQARASLRQGLFRLRTSLGARHANVLEATSGWIKLRREAVQLDTDFFDRNDLTGTPPTGLPLDGLTGFDQEIDDLLQAARADLRHQTVAWLARAARAAEARRDYNELERLARQGLSLEPYDETALRALMTALWRQGRRNLALQAFQDTSHRIRTELSVSVEDETQTLYREIRSARDVTEAPAPVSPEPDPKPEGATAVPPGRTADEADSPEAVPHLRHVAAMHILSERLLSALQVADPEEAESRARGARDAIAAIVTREGGRILGSAGPHLSYVFGVDRPDESPALSAAFAAYEIAGLDCAVALHSGSGLVGPGIETYPLALVAQSLAGSTPIGTVRITQPVEAACRGAFDIVRAEPLPLDRSAEQMPIWRLAGETTSRSGFDIRVARGLSPFCGRDAECAALVEVLQQDGRRIALITGEPGIGKSRLAYEFHRLAKPDGMIRVQFARGETGGGLTRFRQALKALLGSGEVSDAAAHLPTTLAGLSLPADLEAPLRAILAPEESGNAWLALPRGRRFQDLAEAIIVLAEATCGRNGMLLVEDAHWADEDGRMLLDLMVRKQGAAGPMILITQRPSVVETWSDQPHVRQIDLRPLDDRCAAVILGASSIPETTRRSVLSRGGGIPLFLEELSRAINAGETETSLESAQIPGAHDPVPMALRGLLSHRMDTLDTAARRVLDAAAVLGATPSETALQDLSELRRDAFEAALSELANADLLYRIRSYPQRVFAFRHALVQDAAYHGIPQRRRAELHAGVMALHDREAPATGGDLAAELALHAFEGGLFDRAIDLASEAAQDAARRSAYAAAFRMTELALRAIKAAPPGVDNRRREADILAWRRPLLWPLRERARMVEGLERAEEIARELEDDRRLAEICIQRAYIHADDGKADLGLEYCDRGEAAARRAGEDDLVAEISLARCQTQSLRGRMRAALDAIHPHRSAWDDRRDARNGLLVTRHVMLHYHLARANAALGSGNAAWDSAIAAAETACETSRPVDRYIASRALSETCAQLGAKEAAIRAFETAAGIADQAELPAYIAWAEAEIGELQLGSDDHARGAAALRRLLEAPGDGLLRIARIKARAALACAEDALPELACVLEEAEAIGMPMVIEKILRTMSRLLQDKDPDKAAQLLSRADRITRSEGLRTGSLPPGATPDRMLARLSGTV
ncbi:AAA family ATPase [Allosediminivita pacifica]|uniref:Transcriptional regulator n=1 Tax=Allosediminivita pacifica TaxID=1267769 RepID=A0A2T6AD75_9RHOB|nr:AAA family ATPase [Allosediminivita pacifica]PTX41767.1 transcriptional regulator [Allosediminivita pacifica]GGB22691.1 hypothetical protein GCM10011324_35880 [Allosediminivita pacifica]